jgi:hypothetical protein
MKASAVAIELMRSSTDTDPEILMHPHRNGGDTFSALSSCVRAQPSDSNSIVATQTSFLPPVPQVLDLRPHSTGGRTVAAVTVYRGNRYD